MNHRPAVKRRAGLFVKESDLEMIETDPHSTSRAQAFELWMHAPMPMVTLFKTLDVTRLVRFSRRRGLGFNLLMCWCIGQAAKRVEEFYLLPVGEKLMRFEHLAVNTVVALDGGGINTCDIPVSDSLSEFARDYAELTARVRKSGEEFALGDEYMVIGTSALTSTELDGAVNIYAGFYNNPFMIWGRYRGGALRVRLPVSFQFHHTQMDGQQAAQFLEYLQQEIRRAEM